MAPMKIKLKKDRSTGGRVLVIEGARGETPDYRDLERLQRGDLASFLPIAYGQKSKAPQFTYQVGSCLPLNEVLAAPFAPGQLRALLVSVLNMVQASERERLSRLRIVFEPQHVFLDPHVGALRFAYIPLASYTAPSGEAALIAQLCERALVPQSDVSVRDCVLDYVRRTPILTGIAFEEFLASIGLAAGLGAAAQTAGGPAATATVDTRTEHGWDFVSSALDGAQLPVTCNPMRRALVRESTGEAIPLGVGSFTIGRSPKCAISIGDAPGISRKHALLEVGADGCTLCDLGSTNGVFVNGTRIPLGTAAAIVPGDRISLAEERFTFKTL